MKSLVYHKSGKKLKDGDLKSQIVSRTVVTEKTIQSAISETDHPNINSIFQFGFNHFIVIDDDYLNNLICTHAIKNAFAEAYIQTFIQPEKGLDYISKEYLSEIQKKTILFLDINMPTMTGWDVLQSFEKLSTKIKEQFRIFILSSSVDQRDKKRADKSPYVNGYLEKPLSDEMVVSCVIATT